MREFALVNREAVRKIIKKYHKKISSSSEEMHEAVEGVLKNTPFDIASHEASIKVSNALSMLSDVEAQVGLKSKAHASYMKVASQEARAARHGLSPRSSSLRRSRCARHA